MDQHGILEIERPRSAAELIAATFRLYRRFPWLFFVLAAIVVVPYTVAQVIQFELPEGAPRILLGIALAVADFALVLPLIAAFHLFAVDELRIGGEPEFAAVTRRSVEHLRTVSAATVVSWLGITLGFVALVVPGIFLLLRWSVVAQSAALGEGTWRDALDRSRSLTDDRYAHILAFFLFVALIVLIPGGLLSAAFGFRLSLLLYAVGLPINVATTSFGALAAALLFFDLSARAEAAAAQVSQASTGAAPTGHPLDPDSYSDEDRAPGWYVVPEKPWRMRYWPGDGPDGWSRKTTKTPKKTLAGWWKISDR